MKTDAVTPADLAASVLAVPPLARVRNGAPAIAENRRLVDWLAAGGVSTFMYGGNANFYNVGLIEFPLILEVLNDIAPKGSWVIPSIGADFGKAMDQVAILRSFDFPTAMALPMASATRPAGVATGLRKLADAYRRPIIAYVRAENYIAPRDLAALFADGAVCALKYAVERKDPSEDRYLAALVDAAGAGADRQRHRRTARDRPPHAVRPAALHLGLGLHRAAPLRGHPCRPEGRRRRRRRGAPREIPRLRGPARRALADRRPP